MLVCFRGDGASFRLGLFLTATAVPPTPAAAEIGRSILAAALTPPGRPRTARQAGRSHPLATACRHSENRGPAGGCDPAGSPIGRLPVAAARPIVSSAAVAPCAKVLSVPRPPPALRWSDRRCFFATIWAFPKPVVWPDPPRTPNGGQSVSAKRLNPGVQGTSWHAGRHWHPVCRRWHAADCPSRTPTRQRPTNGKRGRTVNFSDGRQVAPSMHDPLDRKLRP